MTYYLDYSATAASNTAVPPKGAPEGMRPSEVNDTMRDMMSVIRQLGDASLAGKAVYGGTTTGTSTAYVMLTTASVGVYSTGRLFTFTAHADNTVGATLKVNSLTAKPLRRLNNAALIVGDILAGATYAVVDVGSTFTLLNPSGGQGTAASRNVGTASGNLPEVVDGSGNLNAAINVANKTLANLAGAGLQRIVWASICFSGAGALIGAFNSATVVRNSIGLYTISFPNIGNTVFHADTSIDVTPDSSGTNHNVVSGSRTATGVQIACRKGNTSVDPFDPDVVTVAIFKIV